MSRLAGMLLVAALAVSACVGRGTDIPKSGRDGPYKVSGLLGYLKASPDSEQNDLGPVIALTTDAYKAAQFGS